MPKGPENPPKYIVIAIHNEVKTITVGDTVEIDYFDSHEKKDKTITGVVTDVSQAGSVYGVELGSERSFISTIIKDVRVLPKKK
jgi:hypothetical protein